LGGGFSRPPVTAGLLFNQQGATSWMDLASWFARLKKTARMTLPFLDDGSKNQENSK
jgi:hypothetical protein